MPKGGKLTIRTSADGTEVRVEVQDTGVGISPENMRKLFTPFFTTKREVKGVGLGLAVSYGIIQRHHGRIEVKSKEGEGSTFTVHLPRHYEEKS
jgi:signal transduction histidine kinase